MSVEDIHEATARHGQCRAFSLILVEHDDALARPAERGGLLGESVLQPLALEMAAPGAETIV
jgi:hypothetical protein